MAKYEHLPIFKKAMELSVYLEGIVRNFSRYHKYGIGAELRSLARHMVRLIIQANSCVDKSVVLRDLVTACEEMKMLLVLAKDIKALTYRGISIQAAVASAAGGPRQRP